VFRIENQATVRYLQNVGLAGHLTTVAVTRVHSSHGVKALFADGIASILYSMGMTLTITVIILFSFIQEWWGIGIISMLILARLINTVVIMRRSELGWKGAKEPGVEGNLLVLLSQDRWIRMEGFVDDLKEVTAGQWLRDETTIEGFATSFATLVVYVSAVLGTNLSATGSFLLGSQLLLTAGLLGLCNSLTRGLRMYNCMLGVAGEPHHYTRRIDMAKELVEQSGRRDWAIGLGLILPAEDESTIPIIL